MNIYERLQTLRRVVERELSFDGGSPGFDINRWGACVFGRYHDQDSEIATCLVHGAVIPEALVPFFGGYVPAAIFRGGPSRGCSCDECRAKIKDGRYAAALRVELTARLALVNEGIARYEADHAEQVKLAA
jgi:hypothetical protein